MVQDVRQTFLEFWPRDLLAHALPHVAVPVEGGEAAALRRCHRVGRDEGNELLGLARRVTAAAGDRPCFLRLGYGSWAGPQMAEFGTLEVAGVSRAHRVLSLRDRRLAEIARRWGHGYGLHVFVRGYVPLGPEDERRTHVVDNRVAGCWLRHAPQTAAPVPEIAAPVAALLPPGCAYFADFIRVNGGWFLSDLNPVLAPAERRATDAVRAALSDFAGAANDSSHGPRRGMPCGIRTAGLGRS